MAVNSEKAINKSETPPKPVVLSSNWGALSSKLIATISPIVMAKGKHEADGSPIFESFGNISVAAPIIGDASISLENNFNSPFESANPESRVPAIMAMLQTGGFQSLMSGSDGSDPATLVEKGIKSLGGSAENVLDNIQGKSNFTKMNSQMVYVSSSAPEFTVTLFFRAWQDAKKEVEDPVKQLLAWSVPQKLGYLPSIAGAVTKLDASMLFPSTIPLYVQLTYAGKTYSPLEVKSISVPLTAPMDKDGNRLAVAVELSLGGLMALDQADIDRMYVK